jgi:hypothetical protein
LELIEKLIFFAVREIICSDMELENLDLRVLYPHGPAATHVGSVARWQKFQPKSSKGAAEKKSWLKEFVAKFWLNFIKSGRKGAAENFQKKFLIFSYDNHV